MCRSPPRVVLSCCLLFLPVLVLCADPSLNDDVLGLIVFKADLQDPTGRLASWNEDDRDPCGWSGVRCDPRTGRVVELLLDGFSLSGKIGRGLFQLQSLQTLSLSRNNLSGSLTPFTKMENLREPIRGIPPSLGSCSTLASLNLSSNQLSGSLPGNLWWLNALRTLDLSFNLLSGEIPPGIEKMYNLRTISLRGNRLSGSLPDGIGGCLLLKSLDLGENQLSGNLPMSMRKLSLCNAMRLGMNSFSGELPAWIDEMSSLEALDLSSNGFVGAIPGSIGNLHQLKELDVSGNGLTGSVPETITGCRALLEVDFSDNSLTGELPQWIFELGLQQISLSGNKLTGSLQIPNPVSHALQAPDSSNITFSDGLPVGIASIRSLRLLNLSRNSFSGPIPASIGDLAAHPPEIGGAVALRELRLQKNSLSGRIPSQIENCTFLSVLILSMNQLSGSIPPNLANLTNLQVVDISRNRLSGTLPKQLGDLPHLVAFNISHNLFSGDLPSGNFFNTIPPPPSCPAVLPKPIVLDPSSSSSTDSTTGPTLPTNARHKKIILSISALVAIAAAALITVGVAAVTVLNLRVLSAATVTNSAAALASRTTTSAAALVMFSGADPEFSAGAHAVLNKDCELGRGGFGAVYKTILRDGRQVAIKKLTVSGLVKSQDDFQREVKKLGQLRHPNLVAMEGFYWTPSLQFLIYEYVPCGSLHSHLHSGDSAAGEVLSWRERFDIVAGIAKGLAHLHRCSIIHYNVKSSNVLIDGAGEAKVGDYGLAKLLPMLDRYVLSSKVQSALGYVAPELASHRAKITDKCDVYGFGVLVLEIVTGRKPVEYADDDVVVLSDVARGALEEGRVVEVVDWRLKGRFPPEEAAPLVKLGLICTSHVPSNRPEMAEVVGCWR
ncbi:unnamed protein product [Spirodela intermedia]|uniref:Protein kinase domain-containing protein n=1 Tax=Spirodela intermedia TaxID=51605 RepID=A0A7I8IV56_SPIIN|nr:unnamed protein product [Spirodela intermedia]CAA6661876.1 unnamed protein product [Spirodela intermedia]